MKSPYFSVKELVCKHVYERYGEKAAMFLDDKLIETLNVIREQILCAPHDRQQLARRRQLHTTRVAV